MDERIFPKLRYVFKDFPLSLSCFSLLVMPKEKLYQRIKGNGTNR